MTNANHVVITQLASGTMVMARVIEETDKTMTLDYPLEMSVGYDVEGTAKMYFARWMAYSPNNRVVIMLNSLEAITLASDFMVKFYDQKVDQFKKALAGDVEPDDPFSEGSADAESQDEGSDDWQDVEDQGDGLHNFKGNTTIH